MCITSLVIRLVGALHRMVSGPQGDLSSFWYLEITYSRPVRHLFEQQGWGVLFLPASHVCWATICRQMDSKVFCTCIPLPLLYLALHKMIQEEAQGIVVILWWPRRRWLPPVLELLGYRPVLLPEYSSLLLMLDGPVHPDLRNSLDTLGRSLHRWGISREAAATICAALRLLTHNLCHAKWWSIVAGVLDRSRIPFTLLLEVCRVIFIQRLAHYP